jgi:hypothetical protein
MVVLNPGGRLLPGQVVVAEGLLVTYQTDGNFVLYNKSYPVWATMTNGIPPGYVEMQHDGNLVMYDINTVPVWATNTFGVGAVLTLNSEGLDVVINNPQVLWSTPELPEPPPGPTPGPPGDVRKLIGLVEPLGRSFRDGTGARYVHGGSDFGGIVKYHEDRDKSLRCLDMVASHRQFIRVAYRLNGWLWTPSQLTIDPVRDSWWEESVRGYLQAAHDRGLRVNLSCMDMYNCTMQQARDFVRRAAQIAASVSPEVVILHEWNEMRGTVPGGEDDGPVDFLKELTGIWQQEYPWNLRSLSDPANQARSGMIRLSQNPANCALLHNVRQPDADAIRRAYNAIYDNYPGKGVVAGEEAGPNNPTPPGEFNRKVFDPMENRDALVALYTAQIITGQMSTYFNDPALVSRYDLDYTWGFKEIPELWRLMEMPENVGQGRLIPGHKPDAPLQVNGSNAARADSVECPDGSCFGTISGVLDNTQPWKVKAGRTGHLTAYNASGVMVNQHINTGDVIPVGGYEPVVVRIR